MTRVVYGVLAESYRALQKIEPGHDLLEMLTDVHSSGEVIYAQDHPVFQKQYIHDDQPDGARLLTDIQEAIYERTVPGERPPSMDAEYDSNFALIKQCLAEYQEETERHGVTTLDDRTPKQIALANKVVEESTQLRYGIAGKLLNGEVMAHGKNGLYKVTGTHWDATIDEVANELAIATIHAMPRYKHEIGKDLSASTFLWSQIVGPAARSLDDATEKIRTPTDIRRKAVHASREQNQQDNFDGVAHSRSLEKRILNGRPRLSGDSQPAAYQAEVVYRQRNGTAYESTNSDVQLWDSDAVGERIPSSLQSEGFIANPEAQDPSEVVVEYDTQRIVAEALGKLTKRERLVIELHYGFHGPWKTLAEIGATLDVKGGRVRQIEEKALRKLRHPRMGDGLIQCADDDEVLYATGLISLRELHRRAWGF